MGSFINCIKRNSPTQEEAPRERPKLSQEDKAILDCKQARDKIKAYIKRLEENEKSQRERAKELLKNKEKDKAKYCLSQSKMYKMQVENSQNQLAAVEEQINRLDMVKTQQNVFNVLENTNKVLKELQKEVNVERLENIGEDLNDIKAANDEITNFFKNHNVDIEENDQQINNELEKLMKMENYHIESSLPDASNKNVANNVENQQVENKEKEQRVLLEA